MTATKQLGRQIIRRDTGHAFRMLTHIAAKHGAPTSSSEAAEAARCPRSFAHKILRKLVGAGILSAKPGKRGGMTLARAPRDVSMWDVIQTVEGRFRFSLCAEGERTCCAHTPCPISAQWQRLQGKMHTFLVRTTLADILATQRKYQRQKSGTTTTREDKA